MERDVGTGLVRELATGGVARVGSFRHGPGPHRDPREESFEVDTVIVPLGGTWTFHGRRPATIVEPGVVVTGAAGVRFAARHEHETPSDRAWFVELRDTPDELAVGFARDAVPVTPTVSNALADLWKEARSDDVARGLAVDLLALRLTLELARAPRSEPRPRRGTDDAVDAAREHLETRFAEPIDLAELGRVAHLSPFHLARAFRARVGTSPHRYLMDVRLAAAERLLRDGQLTVTRVADRCGFGSLAHFGRRFAERYGMPPSAYRRTFGRDQRTFR